MKRWLILLVMTCAGMISAAENPLPDTNGPPAFALSFSNALNMALQHNLDVIYSQLRVLESEGTMRVTRSTLLPKINGEATQKRQQRSSGASGLNDDLDFTGSYVGPLSVTNPISFTAQPDDTIGPYNASDAEAKLSMSLFDLSKLYEYRASKANKQMTELQFEATCETVLSQAAATYFKVQFGIKTIAYLGQKLNLQEKKLQIVKDAKNTGAATDLDVIKEQVAVSAIHSDLATSQHQVDIDLRTLRNILDLDLSMNLDLTDPLDFRPIIPTLPDEVIASVYSNRPDYLAQKKAEEVARLNKNSAYSGYAPAINLFGNAGYQGETYDELVDVWGIGAGISIPLWDSLETQGDIEKKKSQWEQMRNRTTSLEQFIENDIRTAYNSLCIYTQLIAVTIEDVNYKELSLTMEKDKQQTGNGTELTVTEAEVNLGEAKFKQMEAVFSYNLAVIEWYRVIGDAGLIVLRNQINPVLGNPGPDPNHEKSDNGMEKGIP